MKIICKQENLRVEKAGKPFFKLEFKNSEAVEVSEEVGAYLLKNLPDLFETAEQPVKEKKNKKGAEEE